MTQLLKAQNSYFLEIMYLYIWSITGYDHAKYMLLEYLDCILLMLFWEVDTFWGTWAIGKCCTFQKIYLGKENWEFLVLYTMKVAFLHLKGGFIICYSPSVNYTIPNCGRLVEQEWKLRWNLCFACSILSFNL